VDWKDTEQKCPVQGYPVDAFAKMAIPSYFGAKQKRQPERCVAGGLQVATNAIRAESAGVEALLVFEGAELLSCSVIGDVGGEALLKKMIT